MNKLIKKNNLFFLSLSLLSLCLWNGSVYAQSLEYFSYCSNGYCQLINGEYFNVIRGMPIDLHVTCKKNNQYALTFDDGPSQYYPQLLEVLKKNQVKVTFFVLGDHLDSADSITWFRQAFADGHFMANHTFHHDDLTKLNEQAILETLEKTRQKMMNAIYPQSVEVEKDANWQRLELSSRFLRPPFGNINLTVDKILKAHAYTSVRWNADRYDWNMPGDDTKTSEIILNRLRQQFNFINAMKKEGKLFNQSILDLNHDKQWATVAAIQNLITEIKSRGYEFVTLDQCLNGV